MRPFAFGLLGGRLRRRLRRARSLRLVLHLGGLLFAVGLLDLHVGQHVGFGLLADLASRLISCWAAMSFFGGLALGLGGHRAR